MVRPLLVEGASPVSQGIVVGYLFRPCENEKPFNGGDFDVLRDQVQMGFSGGDFGLNTHLVKALLLS